MRSEPDAIRGHASRPTPPPTAASMITQRARRHNATRSFDGWELERQRSDERRAFDAIEAFVAEEQERGIRRRERARALQAGEELEMAAEIAGLGGFRRRAGGRGGGGVGGD